MGEPQDEYFEHAMKATELFKRSVEIHEKELAGEISIGDAIEIVVDLNERAAAEMQIAIAALDEEPEHRTDARPKQILTNK